MVQGSGLTVSFGHHLPISGGVAGVCWSCGVVRVWSRTAVEAVQVWWSGELAVCSSFHRFSLVLDCPVMHAGSGRGRIDVSACCGMWGQTVSWFYGKRYMGYVVGGARVVLIATVRSITLCARLLLPVRGEQLLATPLLPTRHWQRNGRIGFFLRASSAGAVGVVCKVLWCRVAVVVAVAVAVAGDFSWTARWPPSGHTHAHRERETREGRLAEKHDRKEEKQTGDLGPGAFACTLQAA